MTTRTETVMERIPHHIGQIVMDGLPGSDVESFYVLDNALNRTVIIGKEIKISPEGRRYLIERVYDCSPHENTIAELRSQIPVMEGQSDFERYERFIKLQMGANRT